MEYLIGLALSLAAVGAATAIGFGRERAFFPTLLIVIASYYVLFAAMSGSGYILLLEAFAAGAFLLVAVIGFKANLWFVVAALVSHGMFDLVHHLFVDNPKVPHWWPGFCLTFDVVAGAFLAVLLTRRPRILSKNGAPSLW